MKKVLNISTKDLNKANFYQLIENIVSISEKEPVVSKILKKLKNWVSVMQNSFKKEQFTDETKHIVSLDNLRDRAFIKIKKGLESETYNDQHPEKIVASQTLLNIIKGYGGTDVTDFDYSKETALITNFIKDLKIQAEKEIKVLEINEDINYLEECNNSFKNYYSSRGDLQTQLSNTPAFSRIRKSITEDYRNYIQILESLQDIDEKNAPQIIAVIARINNEIDKFSLLIPKRNETPPTPPTKP